MTDIPEEFQDVPRLPNGNPDFRTKRGKELKVWLNDRPRWEAVIPGPGPYDPEAAPMDGGGTEEAGDERFPAAPTPSHGVLSATEARPGKPVGETPMPNLGTSQSGQWLLAQIAEAYPETRYNQWNRVKATFVHAQRNLLAWRRLTQGR